MTRTELIERLEKASGPDRELDFWCWWYSRRQRITRPINIKDRGAPNYTGSVDAAMTMVRRGWIADIWRGFDDDGEFWSKVILTDSFSIDRGRDLSERREAMSCGPGEPPRYIAAAALRSRAESPPIQSADAAAMRATEEP